MNLSRRSFIASLVAAVAMSPLLCRLSKAVEVKPPEVALSDQQSTWDGRLSPNFCRKYGVDLNGKPIPTGGILL